MSPAPAREALPETLFREENLPSLPTVALEVLRLSRDERVSVEDMGEVIASDPALSAKILKLANSSLYRRSEEITTLPKASVLLGVKTVKLMALSFSLTRGMVQEDDSSDYDLEEYWRHSLILAAGARALARKVGSSREDEAFLCGLLGYLGQLVMARTLREYLEVLDHSTTILPAARLEREILGYDFHRVTGALLEHWGLPELIVRVTSLWGEEDFAQATDSREELELCQILALASAASEVICEIDKGQALARLHRKAREDFGWTEETIEDFLVGLQLDVCETASVLSLDVAQPEDYTRIVEDARQQMVEISLNTALDLQATTSRQQELEREKQVLEKKAYTDGLTGIDNRESFEDFFEDVLRGHLTRNRPSCIGLMMVDIDHFKSFNDTHGHLVGDAVLRQVARVLVDCVRETDMAARFGGEEFVILLPGAPEESLQHVAERIRKSVEESQHVTEEGASLSVTISLGGIFSDEITGIEQGQELLRQADERLYEAKKSGRNRWVLGRATHRA